MRGAVRCDSREAAFAAEEPPAFVGAVKPRLNTPGFWATLLVVLILLVVYVQVIVASQPNPTGQQLDFSTLRATSPRTAGIERARVLDQDSYVEGTYRPRSGRPRASSTRRT